MACNSLLRLLLLGLTVGHVSSANSELHKRIKHDKSFGNPGMLLKIMPTGMAYFRELGMSAINKEIARLQFKELRQAIDKDRGYVRLTGTRVTSYSPPREYHLDVLPPTGLNWIMNHFDISASGHYDGWYRVPLLNRVDSKGQFDATMRGVRFLLGVEMFTTRNGSPRLKANRCRFSVRNLDVHVSKSGALMDFALALLKGTIIQKVRPMMEAQICQKVKQIINREANIVLETMPLKVGLNEPIGLFGRPTRRGRQRTTTRRRRNKRQILGEHANKIDVSGFDFLKIVRTKPFVLDYRLLRSPEFGRGIVSLFHKGEISWQGKGGTPFAPRKFRTVRQQKPYMVQFYGSDYLANSLLYHAYKRDLLKVTVNHVKNPQLKNLLSINCDDGFDFCVGDVLESVADQFPDSYLEIVLQASEAPALFFQPNKGTFELVGDLMLFARNPTERKKYKVAATKMFMRLNMTLNFDGYRVGANMTVDEFTVDLKKSYVDGLDQDQIGEIGFFGSSVVAELANALFKNGLPVPTIAGVKLHKPLLTIHDRFAMVRSYFTMDETVIGNVIKNAVRRGIDG